MHAALFRPGLRKPPFHGLDHTFGSLLIQDHASLKYIKVQMGYSSIQVMVDVSGHLVPGADISWADRFDATTTTQHNATLRNQTKVRRRRRRRRRIYSKLLILSGCPPGIHMR